MNKIKYLIMDVDGTLTDGKIYMGNDGEALKAFNIKDGLGIHDILPEVGIIPIIFTGRNSKILENRCKEVGILHLYQGVSDKTTMLEKFIKEQGGNPWEFAYAGDDLNDLSCMERIKRNGGLVGVPADACNQVKNIADFISTKKGGDGAVREFIEWICNIEQEESEI